MVAGVAHQPRYEKVGQGHPQAVWSSHGLWLVRARGQVLQRPRQGAGDQSGSVRGSSPASTRADGHAGWPGDVSAPEVPGGATLRSDQTRLGCAALHATRSRGGSDRVVPGLYGGEYWDSAAPLEAGRPDPIRGNIRLPAPRRVRAPGVRTCHGSPLRQKQPRNQPLTASSQTGATRGQNDLIQPSSNRYLDSL